MLVYIHLTRQEGGTRCELHHDERPGHKPQPRAKESASRPVGQQPAPPDDPRQDELYVRIAKRAYEMYLRRGNEEGDAPEDWLEAEREVLSQMSAGAESRGIGVTPHAS
jgi:hypothetical protein